MTLTASRGKAEPGATVAALRKRVAQLEAELAASRARQAQAERGARELEDFVENAAVGLHQVGPDGTILWANRADWEMLGYRREEFVGHNIAEFHADRDCVASVMAELRAGKSLHDRPVVLRCKDGTTRHALVTTNAHFVDGHFVNTRCFTRDVTAQWLAEQALAEARQHLAAIVESSDDAIIGVTLGGRITSWNQGAARLFGYAPGQILGEPITTLIPDELHHEEAEILARIRAGERVEHYETVRKTRDGTRLDISLTVSPVRDRAGAVVGASKVARDITERKQVLRTLADSDRRKDEFLAILAHELRNPLAPIRYALTIAKQPAVDEHQRRRAEAVIERQVAHMARLLDDLLDVSRIARGRVELRKKWIDLTSVVGAAIDTARPLLDSRQQSLDLELPREPLRLEADPVRVAQVLSNLLTNASKYSEPGGKVRLRAWQEAGEICLAVRDDGIGIDPEMMARLFTMFSQAQPARSRSEGGLGIGLALVRAFVELHGGRVEARSEGIGKGSEFVVRLPVGPPPSAQAPGAPEAAAGRAARLRVLIADDNEDNAETCATLLRLWGHDVRVARNGQQALDLARSFRPQAAVLDIGMPLMSGYQVAEALRSSRDWGRRAVLIAVTGWGQEEDRRKAGAAGFDHHLSKPVDPERLREILELVPALA